MGLIRLMGLISLISLIGLIGLMGLIEVKKQEDAPLGGASSFNYYAPSKRMAIICFVCYALVILH